MASHAIAPLLTIETLTEYPAIQIDGVRYGLRPADALSVFAFHRLRAVIPPLAEILAKGADLTETDSEALDALLIDLCALILDAPAAVRAKLSILHRMSIYTSFVQLPHGASILHVGTLQPTENPTATPPTRIPSTGDASPQPSPTSTAARRTTGSRRSRSRWSAPALP